MKKGITYLVLYACFWGFIGQVAFAQTNGDYPDLSAARLKAKLDSGEKVFLLCPLSEIMFNEKHIPGSINIPSKQIMKTKLLPKDKDTLIVTYCLGPN